MEWADAERQFFENENENEGGWGRGERRKIKRKIYYGLPEPRRVVANWTWARPARLASL